MKKAKDTQIKDFLERLQLDHDEHFQMLQALREIVFDIHPYVEERIMYGGIMFSDKDDFGGIFAYQGHISFEFSQGATLDDPEGFLEGTGKFRRHLKMRSLADIEKKQVRYFVQQTIDLL